MSTVSGIMQGVGMFVVLAVLALFFRYMSDVSNRKKAPLAEDGSIVFSPPKAFFFVGIAGVLFGLTLMTAPLWGGAPWYIFVMGLCFAGAGIYLMLIPYLNSVRVGQSDIRLYRGRTLRKSIPWSQASEIYFRAGTLIICSETAKIPIEVFTLGFGELIQLFRAKLPPTIYEPALKAVDEYKRTVAPK